jgi:GTP diphosphokinase / guanosine-3',5'-bis(diphosphate) 3'-diphosphatase
MIAALHENIQCALQSMLHTSTWTTGEYVDYLQSLYGDAKRKTGEPCLNYISQMARRLSFYKLDHASLMAAMTWSLFDTQPDKTEDIKNTWGNEVFDLAARLAELAEIDVKTGEEAENEKLRRLILALARDIRVVFLRLVDRVHVLSVIDRYGGEDALAVAIAARDIYAPLANRLGIGKLKSELEDLSLRIRSPEIYSDIRRRVRERSEHHAVNVERIKVKILEKLESQGIQAEIKGRIKNIDSIYRKMVAQKIDFDQVYDVLGIRIITEKGGVQDCYAVLGLIHSLWKPIPHRFKDFLANPKENGYQSIHTSVIGPSGTPIEIQIRSRQMDDVAEVGIAAHWRYKDAGAEINHGSEKFTWLRKAMYYLTENPNPADMLEIFKVDLFPSEVYVFTPRGDVKSLPAGSTVVDFAFSIHTDVGLRCRHGKINKKLVPLRTKLQNGDIVEIITSRNAHPNADWLKYVRTSVAKNKIRSYLREVARDSMVKQGLDSLKKELKKQRIPIKGLCESDEFREAVVRLGYSAPEDVFAAIGFGEISIQQVINRLVTVKASRSGDRPSEPPGQELQRQLESVRVVSGADIVTRFARCCEPIPGDRIVGYITRGRGITIHSVDCPNLKKLGSDRIVPMRWEAGDNPTYPLRIVFEGYHIAILTREMARVVAEHNGVIISQHVETVDSRRQKVRGVLLLEMPNGNEQGRLLDGLRSISGMMRVSQSRSRKKH